MLCSPCDSNWLYKVSTQWTNECLILNPVLVEPNPKSSPDPRETYLMPYLSQSAKLRLKEDQDMTGKDQEKNQDKFKNQKLQPQPWPLPDQNQGQDQN